jgi:UDP-3-O-[3-hydroxymyristoyl] glucosamine N-acyltransferase
METTIKELANLLNGIIIGDGNLRLTKISRIDDANKGDLSFISNPKYQKFIYSTNASCVIVNEDFKYEKTIKPTLIKVKDSYQALSIVTNIIKKDDIYERIISSNSVISKSADIKSNVHIGHFTTVGANCIIEENVTIFNNCVIGDNVTIKSNSIIHSSVNIKSESIIGENNIIHSGAIIGSDGFGFANLKNELKKIQQIGNVVIKNNVEIGANTTIDRASIGSTLINEGVKLDNLIQIGHNVEVGKNTAIAGLTAIAGSTKIGENCLIGGQCAITGHIKIGNNVRVAGNSGIASNIKDNQTIQGEYGFNKQDFQRSYVLFKKLPKIVDRLSKLENGNSL